MSHADEKAWIAETVAALRSRHGIAANPARRGPVPLSRFLDECNLLYVGLPKLTRAEIALYLHREGIDSCNLEQTEQADELLAGFLLAMGADGYVFVGEAEPKAGKEAEALKLQATSLGRRRFTAAHELGHFVLHREQMGRWNADTHQSIVEEGEPDHTTALERQANCFAAELLMPAEVCFARAEEFRQAYKVCPRTPFAYHLAAELLVSPEAMRYRLKGLEVADES